MIEEYPPYLRSITLERLSPATEYSLQVVAVYLNKFRRPSRRVEFISPTDNESRRFKENTYRPIHRYPDDEPRELRYGLAQVRGEELTIVAIALLFWIATICLFFNNWGKIRMLEPYQPAYRDTAGAAATFAHHHPSSMHNLNGANILPSTVVASSSPITALSPTGVGLAGSTVVSGTTSPYANGEPQALEVGLVAGEPGQARQHNMHQSLESNSSLVVGSRKASRSLALLAGRRRYETIADDSPVRRTYAELNYLFQSKAQALAKAQIWSRHQSSLQCGSVPTASSAFPKGPLVGASQRRISSLLRQRQMSQCPGQSPLQVQSPVSPLLQCSLDAGSLERLRDQIRASRSSSGATPLGRHSLERQQPRHGSASTAGSRFGSLERPDEESQATILSQELGNPCDQLARQAVHRASTNKLRRLLFMSKSHQHHHIATSTSSSTTLIGQPTSFQLDGLATAKSGNGPAARAQCGSPEALPSGAPKTGINSLSADLSSASGLELSQPAALDANQQHFHQSPNSSGGSTSQPSALRSSVNSLPSGGCGPTWALRRALSPGEHEELDTGLPEADAAMKLTSDRSRRRVEHHILIEPPSPPNKHDSFALQLAGKVKLATARSSKRPSIYFEEAPPQPRSDSDSLRYEELLVGYGEHEMTDEHEDAFAKLARYQAELQLRQRQLTGGSPTQAHRADLSRSHQSTTEQEVGEPEQQSEDRSALRPRMSSVFVTSPFSHGHRGSFAMLRALSQKKSKSAEDVAHLSSLVLQIWARNRNPLLQSVSQQQLDGSHRARQKCSLTVSHL